MHGLDVETTALSPHEGRLRLVQLSDGKRAQVFDLYEHDEEEVRAAILEHDDLVAHNATFERKWLKAKLGLDIGKIHDTMIMSQVLYTGTNASRRRDFSHSLASVAGRELKVEMSKDEEKSDWDAIAFTPEQLRYAAFDAAVLPKLAGTLLRRIDRAGLRKVYELELRVSHAVAAMEERDVAVHRDRLEALIEEYTEKATRLKAELTEEWGINPGSGKQLIELFELEEREDWPKTAGGAPSTNQDAMHSLVAEYPSVEKWVEWKEAEKIRSTYGVSLLKRLTPEGRIHARFKSFGTATGRFSSANPNLQNIPRRGDRGTKMRGLFWSGADDRVLIKADYASIELWVAAIVWDDPHMQHALQQGVNMHVATAASLYGLAPDEVTSWQKAIGKIVNFALLYGGSPRRILEEFTKNGIPIDGAGAVEIHCKFFDTYKGFAKRKEAARASYNASKYQGDDYHEARTAIGRRRNFADRFGPLLNHEIQGTGADSPPYPII